ncbi:hypothetical protein BO226_24425 (plasmid) [Rhodococcus sp. 2G]|uniref:hypothetical protein n=1 Tax=Rhodococcus sp. 2G TaxID=1570939 RepID=UPI000903137B|nr:hypothetical protein [Rhodococcus sp. 2G]APE12514.1 hypothetical protein BO226_24425 [Rhodococcus sp. 2G]
MAIEDWFWPFSVPGLELLYLHSSAVEGDVWQPGDQRGVCPILMHLIDHEWKARNLGSDQDPTAGGAT